ncbi:hypothetical protein GM658_12565 [Pseudoduganella eburnea]|uniref:Uncharacterized protein n=1 Tax=Massilia eburnea TaxID=1776165 RepID=A0A6L6QH40_9BURK|nr:hypothetical protein [Massilia eburnea]MTW11430.1 hypothetical protein [Massilia eburnea]
MSKRLSPAVDEAGQGRAAQAVTNAAVLPDPYAGLGGTYLVDPQTGLRVPSEETLIHHQNHGKDNNGQEVA